MTVSNEFFKDEMTDSEFGAIPLEERYKVRSCDGASAWTRHLVRYAGGNGNTRYLRNIMLGVFGMLAAAIAVGTLAIYHELPLLLGLLMLISLPFVFFGHAWLAGNAWARAAGYRFDWRTGKSHRIRGHEVTKSPPNALGSDSLQRL